MSYPSDLQARHQAALDALADLFQVQQYSTGWDNGVTDSTGTVNEGAYWHSRVMDRAAAVLVTEGVLR